MSNFLRSILASAILICLYSVSHGQGRYLEEVFSEVSVTTDVPYGVNANILTVMTTGEAEPQTLLMDVYQPVGDTENARPLVILCHSGRFLPFPNNNQPEGNRTDSALVYIANRLAKMGYVVASVDYRQGWNPFDPDQTSVIFNFVNAVYRASQDLKTCVRFFRKNAAEEGNQFGIHPNKIALWGDGSGGYATAWAASLDDYNELLIPKLMFLLNGQPLPMILESQVGNIYATSVGVASLPGFPGVPVGDTLSYPNNLGYGSEVQLAISSGGGILDTSFLDINSPPFISFQVPTDQEVPYQEGIFFSNLPIPFMVHGSYLIQQKAFDLGLNDGFAGLQHPGDHSDVANARNDGYEGLFPLFGSVPSDYAPWHWWSASNPNSAVGLQLNPDMSAAKGKAYCDSMLAYLVPRACVVLGLGCDGVASGIEGEAYIDQNGNGTWDGNEPPAVGTVLEVQPGNFHSIVQSDGSFNRFLPPGDYSLQAMPPLYHSIGLSPMPYPVSIPDGNTTVGNISIPFWPIPDNDDLRITVSELGEPRPGFYNYFQIDVKNIGTTTQDAEVSLFLDTLYLYSSSNPPATVNGNNLTWSLPIMLPGTSESMQIALYVPVNVAMGQELSSTALVNPTANDQAPDDNHTTISQIVVSSFDPNDKRVLPAEGLLLSQLQAGEYLDYTIRFQNTGTAEAINIRLEDTLSQHLNVASFEMLAASHPYRLEFGGANAVAWYFDNINLPDSLSDEPGSHGFVRFRIRPRSGLVLGDVVENTAFIYFDFNAAVVTNTAVTEIIASLSVANREYQAELRCQPNPTSHQLTITNLTGGHIRQGRLRVMNIHGQVLSERDFDAAAKLQVDVGTLPSGTYFLLLENGEGAYYGKFVKQ